jgi:transcriptional regulator with XRE-family HTH domain
MSALILQFPVMGKFLNRIKELRLRADMSQQELADLAGCSKMHISKTERGDTRLDIHWMAQISAALGVAPGDLLLHTPAAGALSRRGR